MKLMLGLLLKIEAWALLGYGARSAFIASAGVLDTVTSGNGLIRLIPLLQKASNSYILSYVTSHRSFLSTSSVP